jgi:2,3-bisphosphoglycerate-independent phosphoglycerate mutase
MPCTTVLLILDGWGNAPASADNAISQAATPNWDKICAEHPCTQLDASGLAVGLPEGQMGNSEVGHMNIGSGRIVYQDIARIDRSIADGSFFSNTVLKAACKASPRLHILGLLSPGGVHSHERHIHAMLELAKREQVSEVIVHAFLDGRDTPPQSALPSLLALEESMQRLQLGRIGTLSGRYYAMDRDKRWDRIEKAYRALVEGQGEHANNATAALEAAYAQKLGDEFVKPTIIGSLANTIQSGDSVIFMNFRSDRAQQLSRVLIEPEFSAFTHQTLQLTNFTTLTRYAKDLHAAVAFPQEDLTHVLGECVSAKGLKQLRLAETEKYAHVTYFFNGKREQAFPG